MKKLRPEVIQETVSRLVYLTIALVGIILILLGALGWGYLQPKGRLNCSSFGSYADALHFYRQGGASSLDRNHNGIPCETLYKYRNQ